jgi:hypothetical protein
MALLTMATPGFLGLWNIKRAVAMSIAAQGVLKHAVSVFFMWFWYRHTHKSTADPLWEKLLTELPDQNFRFVLEK